MSLVDTLGLWVDRSTENVSCNPIYEKGALAGGPFVERINTAACTLFGERAAVNDIKHRNFWIMSPAILSTFAVFLADDEESSLEARQQIAELLGLHEHGFNAVDWCRSFSYWVSDLAKRAQSTDQAGVQEDIYKLSVATGVAIDQGDLNSSTRCMLRDLDLESIPWTVESVNSWASEKTQGLIKELITETDPDQVFAILTAAYVKGIWELPFDQKQNSRETFNNSDGTTSKICQMNLHADSIRTGYAPGVEILELAMRGGLSMLFMQAVHSWDKNPPSLADFISGNGEKSFSAWMKDYEGNLRSSSGLGLGVPKCDMTDEADLLSELSATPLMSAMKKSDWQGMATIDRSVQLGQMKAAGALKINEEGAEGAQVVFSPSFYDSCDPTFYIRKRFAVAMVDTENKALLGLGMFNKLDDMPEA